jgi:hypothetical protein
VLFAHKSWEVQVVSFDDGTVECLAQVSDGSRSFSLWADVSASIELQFYDDAWNLGEGDTANLTVAIDGRAPWTLNNAELHKQSVFFTLPDEDSGVDFITEVMRGNVLYLNAENGDAVESYSLAGSSASVGALIDCMDALGSDANPFN